MPMIPSLAALIALQSIDSAAEASRRRLAELPEAERQSEEQVAAAQGAVEAVKARIEESHASRRALEREVAAVDTRLARFEDHKAAVKTNQEYTALLHEIATAKTEKDGLEERILLIMEDSDRLAAELKAAEAALAAAKRDGDATRARLAAEHAALSTELARLDEQRAAQRPTIEPRALAVYEQLLKNRRGLAVARLEGDICAACHVRLRPHVIQTIRRNDSLVQCESCQRVLYWEPPAQPPADAAGRV